MMRTIKLDIKDWTNLLLFIVVVILMYIVLVKIGSEGVECTLNPLVYGAEQLQGINSKPLQCSCSLYTDGDSQTLHFNSTSSWLSNPFIDDVYIPVFNLSNLYIVP